MEMLYRYKRAKTSRVTLLNIRKLYNNYTMESVSPFHKFSLRCGAGDWGRGAPSVTYWYFWCVAFAGERL